MTRREVRPRHALKPTGGFQLPVVYLSAFVVSIVRVNGDLLTYVPQARAYWSGKGDAAPSVAGLVRQGLLMDSSDRAKLAAQAARGAERS
eukprot:Skav230084  [mRNA]  locus=scaffold2569:315907:317656:- [translate_table: standard]